MKGGRTAFRLKPCMRRMPSAGARAASRGMTRNEKLQYTTAVVPVATMAASASQAFTARLPEADRRTVRRSRQ
ncbi:hypothetical protein GCM10022377_16680 [Zhihengliuella alba]|uniref:Uncharacterized protein n=1 Tax=Zhihengliuella alba TaxID=547018 RepID=A0ABP7DET4_9MICC